MAKRAKSMTLKKQEASAEKACQLDHAVQMYKNELLKPQELRLGLRSIAKQFPGVSYATLWRRVQGKRSMQEFNASKRKLTSAEEEVLVQLIETSAGWSNPLSYSEIARFANNILQRREEGGNPEYVGVNWVYRFLERHHNRVRAYSIKRNGCPEETESVAFQPNT